MIDIAGGKIVSDKPVEVKSVEWLVKSNRMEVTDSGDVVRFDRGVSVTIEGETARSDLTRRCARDERSDAPCARYRAHRGRGARRDACTRRARRRVAQKNQTAPPNALQGFSQNRDEPVKIQAASLEVRDKERMATFSGDVHVVQGDTEMRCKSLVVFYDEDPDTKGAKTSAIPRRSRFAGSRPRAASR